MLGRRAVLHVHESGTLAASFLETCSPPAERNHPSRPCSPSVHTDLLVLTGQSCRNIAMIPSVPDDSDVLRRSMEPPDRPYSADELVVGCCGTVERRKVADLWVEVAREVRKAIPDQQVRFVWIGEIAQPIKAHDAGVEFLGPTPNPYPHMRRFDIATLPSRNDPFPLVVLEAMLLGTPVVAFGVGGVAEQIGDAGL